MKSSILAVVSSPFHAESVVDNLRSAGFSHNDISVLIPDSANQFAHIKSIEARRIASTGSPFGSLTSWLIGLGSLVVLGAGPLTAAGPLFAGVGTTGCDLNRALSALGFHAFQAKQYADDLDDGNILIAANTEDSSEVKLAQEIFEKADARDIGQPDSLTPAGNHFFS